MVNSFHVMSSVLVSVTIAVTTHRQQKQLGAREGLFHSKFNVTVHHQKQCGQEFKQGRELEAGDDVEVMEECYLLYIHHDLLSLLF